MFLSDGCRYGQISLWAVHLAGLGFPLLALLLFWDSGSLSRNEGNALRTGRLSSEKARES